MANKKTFDREKMYRKIMPTYYDNNFALAHDDIEDEDDYQPPRVVEGIPDVDSEDYDSGSTVVSFPTKKKQPQVPFGGFPSDTNSPLLRTAEIERMREQHDNTAIYNLTEKIILEKLDMVMESMNCCRCDRCKMDVVALTLNNMEPHYVVHGQNSPDYAKLEKEISDQATKAVLKAALRVRKYPKH